MVLSGSVVAQGDNNHSTQTEESNLSVDSVTETEQEEISTTESNATIDESLQRADGSVEVVVRFDAADQQSAQTADVGELKTHAETSQTELKAMADDESAVAIAHQFWIANAALVEIDTDSVTLRELAALEGVTAVHENIRVETPETETGDDDRLHTAAATPATPGLEKISVPTAWEQFDTRGDGVSVAVLDSGIDATHPDLELTTDNESDPTYPGGWAEFDSDGDKISDSEPYESYIESHGTHVSGTVAGGNESGTHIGVAPEVDLMHGLVLPEGDGSIAQIMAGMEWAVENEADVMVMSLGIDGAFLDAFIEPIQNAESAGVSVVSSSGNAGEDTSSSPGNVYESTAVGSVDTAGEVWVGSSGETIDTEADWEDPPESWPDSYVVPDVTAPGVNVESTIDGGEYGTDTGTSMAAPHVAGIYALALATDNDRSTDDIQSALEQTAEHPDPEADTPDDRYGYGIVDASGTLGELTESGVNGTVTDDTDTPITNATLSFDSTFETETDSDGSYEVPTESGDYTVTVDAFGFEPTEEIVTVTDGSVTTTDFTLEPTLESDIVDDQPSQVEAGETITAKLEVANGESLVVETADTTLDGDETLTVNGETAEIGEAVELEEDQTTVTVALETTNDTPESVALEHTLSGLGTESTVATGSTAVFEEFLSVAVVDDADEEYTAETVSALEESLEGSEVTLTDSASITGAESPPHDVYVVQTLSDENATAFVDATQSPAVGVVYLDQWGGDANGIPAYASVTDDPNQTDEGDGLTGPDIEPPVNYTVESTHPILDNASVGTEVPIHTGEFADHTWFTDTNFDVIASVTHSGTEEPVGPALAVDDQSNTVLASSLARTELLSGEEYTDEANNTLAASTIYVAPDDDDSGDDVVVNVSDTESFTDYTGTVSVNTTADDIAGYQATLEYDPDVVHVTATEGEDFDDPVTNIDNENGSIAMAQTNESATDQATLATVELEFVGDREDETELLVNESETQLSDESGTSISIWPENGVAQTLACLPGDVTGTDEVTINDATLAQQHIVGNPVDRSFDANCGDLTRDGEITAADVTLILQEIVGMDEAAPLAGEP